MKSHEIKCEHCGFWTNSKIENCPNCYNKIRANDRKNDLERSKRPDPFKPRFITINDKDNLIVQFLKRVIQFGQLVFYAIVSLLVWITTWAVG